MGLLLGGGEGKVNLTMAVDPAEASADGCTVTPSPGVGEYSKDAMVTIDAQPEQGGFGISGQAQLQEVRNRCSF